MEPRASRGRTYYPEIFLISFAALLLEISYTRIVSFKLFYYFTYMVIGLALLGLGAGSVFVSISGRLKRASTDTIIAVCGVFGAIAVTGGYLVVARMPINTLSVWNYGSEGAKSGLKLVVLCVVLFASFLPAGIVLSTLFSRRPEQMGSLYFADLIGAGLACLIVVPLLGWLGPPATVMLSAFAFAVSGLLTCWRRRPPVVVLAAAVAVLTGLAVPASDLLPEIRPDLGKESDVTRSPLLYSSWSPLFRVDVRDRGDIRALIHDGLGGSIMRRWDGDEESLSTFGYDTDFRNLAFTLRDDPPDRVGIIGAAAGNEVQASLYFGAGHIDAIEINPVTYKLVTDIMADYNGRLADHPKVDYVRADGRTFMARSDDEYDLIWMPAPDSYSATNASTASAFVLSESYLYTSDALVDYLEHVTDVGIVAAQFGEMEFERRPNRTARYVATARAALEELGVDDVSRHFLVSAAPPTGLFPGVSTILVKREPFTDDEVARFVTAVPTSGLSTLVYAPGSETEQNPVTRVITGDASELDDLYARYPYSIDAIDDDKPFFWHFSSFSRVLRDFTDPLESRNVEVAVGERTLVLLLLVAVLLAAVFLLLPFLAIRTTWKRLPRKPTSLAYFAGIGFGFIFLEITLIQRLVLFLGYPTYSLTVTLSSLLIFVGVGALLSGRLAERIAWPKWLPATIGVLILFLMFGLGPVTDVLLDLPLIARIAIAFLLLAPLGTCLGMFMPLGVAAVSKMTEAPGEYVAWGWAVNGFASVIGSVLATVLAMTWGFQVVLAISAGAYAVALVALHRLDRTHVVPEGV